MKTIALLLAMLVGSGANAIVSGTLVGWVEAN